jgi:molecular chaperone DnaK
VLQLAGDNYRVLVTEGDDWLGGDDFDQKLADALANAFWRKTDVELRNSAVDWQRMLVAAEQTKCELSTVDSTLFKLPRIRLPEGEFDMHQKIERAAFERVCLPLFQSTLELCQQALQSVGLQPSQVHEVIVVGGTSRIPFIRRGLERFFGREISNLVNVDDAVALGAGLHAARFSQHRVRGARSLT